MISGTVLANFIGITSEQFWKQLHATSLHLQSFGRHASITFSCKQVVLICVNKLVSIIHCQVLPTDTLKLNTPSCTLSSK